MKDEGVCASCETADGSRARGPFLIKDIGRGGLKVEEEDVAVSQDRLFLSALWDCASLWNRSKSLAGKCPWNNQVVEKAMREVLTMFSLDSRLRFLRVG